MADKQTLERSMHSIKSLTTLNPEAVHNNALNNSISKMQYSFSKTPRFSEDKHRINTHFYDVPSTLTHRATSLGYGNKVDLAASKNPTPSPSHYSLNSDFEQNKKHGISFGLGRQVPVLVMQDVKTNSMFLSDTDKLPAPGAYSPNIRDKAIKYSMRQKLEDRSDQWIRKVPGPGTYNYVDTMNGDCKNFVSKYESAATAKFSILPRLTKDRPMLSPGPAQCTQKNNTDNPHQQASLKFHAAVANKFPVSKRKGLTDTTTKVPGPGEYNSFSEFTR